MKLTASISNYFSYRYVLLAVTMCLLGASQLYNQSPLLIIGSCIIFLFLVVSGRPIDNLYSFIGMIPFFSIFSINGITIGFVFLFIALIKIIPFTTIQALPAIIFSVLLLVITEIWGDIGVASPGVFLNLSSFILYFSAFLIFVPMDTYNHGKTTLIFLTGVIIAQVFLFLTSDVTLTEMVMSKDMIRLADNEKGALLGGAMGFPIYTILVLCFLLRFLFKSKLNTWQIIFCISLIVLEFLITFFTLSRVYFLGLIVLFLGIILYLLKKRAFKAIVVFFLLGIGVYLLLGKETKTTSAVADKYSERSSTDDISTGRFEIFESSIYYLIDNPKALLFGEGIIGYRVIGEQQNKAFQISAHNLYLDALMSFGIVGSLCILILLIYYIKRLKRIHPDYSLNILSFLPLLCYLVMVNTGGSFLDYKTYIYLIFLVTNTYIPLPFETKQQIENKKQTA